MNTYHIYTDSRDFDVNIEAKNMDDALDVAAQKRGCYIDHADMCQQLNIDRSDLNIVEL